jgi:hypothetical protein
MKTRTTRTTRTDPPRLLLRNGDRESERIKGNGHVMELDCEVRCEMKGEKVFGVGKNRFFFFFFLLPFLFLFFSFCY